MGPGGSPANARYVGRFEVRGTLGRGAMGVVLRAFDPAAGREVALKLTSQVDDPRQLARFVREGELAARFDHPGILKVHSAGEHAGRAWIAFELVEEARTLDRAWAALPLRERVELLRDVAAAVGHAHAQGVVHRDLKPENVLVDAAGRARVADFGVATALDLERLTQTGALIGTPAYMAPELLVGDREAIGPASDVWALGVLLFEALTGELPFALAGTIFDLAATVTRTDAPDPRAVAPDVPRPLADACRRALQRAPRDRYPDAGALADDLARWLAGERPLASPPTRVRLWPAAAVGLATVVLGAGLAAHAALTPEPPPAAAPPRRAAAPPPAAPVAAPAEPAQPPRAALRFAPAPVRTVKVTRDERRPCEAVAAFTSAGVLVALTALGEVTWWTEAGEPLGRVELGASGSPHLTLLGGGEVAVGLRDRLFLLRAPPHHHGPARARIPQADDYIRALAPLGSAALVGTREGAALLTYTPARPALGPPRPGFAEHDEPLRGLAVSPDGALVASVTATYREDDPRGRISWLRVFEVATERLRFAVRVPVAAGSLVFAPDGGSLYLATVSGVIVRYGVRDGAQLGSLLAPDTGGTFGMKQRAHHGCVRALALLGRDRLISAGDGRVVSPSGQEQRRGGEARLWNTETGELLARTPVLPNLIDAVALAPDLDLVALATRDGELVLWPLE